VARGSRAERLQRRRRRRNAAAATAVLAGFVLVVFALASRDDSVSRPAGGNARVETAMSRVANVHTSATSAAIKPRLMPARALVPATSVGRPYGGQRTQPPELWSVKLGGCIESTPAVWNGRIYVGTRAGHEYALG
jgi:hypothetical protein